MSNPQFGTRFQREVHLFVEIPEFFSNTVKDKPRVACMPKTSLFCSPIYIQYRLVTQRHKHKDRAIVDIALA